MQRTKICDRIEQLRLRNNRTQREVAEAIGVKRETINQWESGTRNLKTEAIIALAQYFNVTTDYLLGISNKKTMDPGQRDRIDRRVKEIANYHGTNNQEDQLIEEMAELTQAIIKMRRIVKFGTLHDKNTTPKKCLDNMVEEMADVKLVLDQLIYLLDAGEEVQDIMEQKIEREICRITPAFWPETKHPMCRCQLHPMTISEEMGDVECE